MLLKSWIQLQKVVEVVRLLPHYLTCKKLLRSDVELHQSKNPYIVSRHYLEQRGATDIHLYGETPIQTMAKIAREVDLDPNDHFLELGCGRGRGAFWARLKCGCTVSGIEQVPYFVEKASEVAEKLQIDRLKFYREDLTLSDYSQATVVYLYGTCLEEDVIQKVIEKTRELPQGARIVSISYPLEADHLTLIKSFPVRYPWGRTSAYITCRRQPEPCVQR